MSAKGADARCQTADLRRCARQHTGRGRFARFLGSWKWLLALGCALTLSAADTRTPPWETSQLVIGRDLFRENCSVCHDIDKDKLHSRKFGPSLNHLFKNPVMPLSHAKPNRQYVIVRIKYGGALMPAFKTRLNDSEIAALIGYIASK